VSAQIRIREAKVDAKQSEERSIARGSENEWLWFGYEYD